MIRLGLRLTLRGGREAAARLAFTAAGVAVGVGLLLFTLAGFSALHQQDVRWGWLTTSAHNQRPSVEESTSSPLWWRTSEDQFGNRTIERVDLAATGPNSPVPPGVAALPGPGQFSVSPALAALLAATPPAELADRFGGGRQIGTIGSAGLTGPDALIIVVGQPASALAHAPGAVEVRSIETTPRQHAYSTFLRVVLGVGAVGLLFPVLVFVGASSRLAAARREQRFAALRLVGATPRQVSVIAAVEAAAGAVAGVLGGFVLFFALRPAVAAIPFAGDPFFTGDLSLPPVAVAVVAVGVPLGAAAAALVSLREVWAAPLGVSRHVTPAAPRAISGAPLLVGLVALAVFALSDRDGGAGRSLVLPILLAFVVTMIGVVTAGPWLTMVGTRLLARTARRPATLIASRRLSDDPARAFRAISGLILAVFVGSVFVSITATVVARRTPVSGAAANDTVVDLFSDVGNGTPSGGAAGALAPGAAAGVLAAAGRTDGARGVTAIYLDPSGVAGGTGSAGSAGGTGSAGSAGGSLPKVSEGRPADGNPLVGLVRCAELARTPGLGRCAAPGGLASINMKWAAVGASPAGSAWPAAAAPAGGLAALPMLAIAVDTTGDLAAVERVRTTLEVAVPDHGPPATVGQLSATRLHSITELQRMTDVGILISVVIAGCSLAVAVAGGLLERRRPFSLLRLAGMPVSVLRRVVALESAVPLVVIAVVSAGTGLLVAALILRSLLGVSLRAPGAEYYLVLLAGLAAALGVVAATLPLLARITGPENARQE